MAEIFARNLAHLRNQLGLTQEKLAAELGFTRASIDAYEGDRAMPPYAKLKTFAKAFGKSVLQITEEKLWEMEAKEPLGDQKKLNAEQQNLTLFGSLSQEDMANSEAWLNQIAIVSQTRLQDYVNGVFDPYADDAARISMPIHDKGQYLAFEAGKDFPFPKTYLIGLKVTAIQDGQIHLIVDKKGESLYRRVYDQTAERGVLVLTPMLSGFSAQDLPSEDLHEIWEVKAFLSYSLPNFKAGTEKAKALLSKLQEEIGRLA